MIYYLGKVLVPTNTIIVSPFGVLTNWQFECLHKYYDMVLQTLRNSFIYKTLDYPSEVEKTVYTFPN